MIRHYDSFQSTRPQLADTVMMVRPTDFAFNEQTAVDNEFQKVPSRTANEINRAALEEFDNCTHLLREAGVKVLVLEKEKDHVKTPDAVFPNNWVSTTPDGNMILFPMATPNRRDEALRCKDVHKLFTQHGLLVNNVVQTGGYDEEEKFLEGTGSMVIDHINRTVYAARSVRTHDEQLDNFVRNSGYYTTSIAFDTKSSTGNPFYHTNVMMSIGEGFSVICGESIVDSEICTRQQVMDSLSKGGRDVIDITLEQAEKYFCGNILHLATANGAKVIAMSESCLKGFTEEQLEVLKKHGHIVAFPIAKTIEFVGGGSARCMIAEVFLPRRKELFSLPEERDQ